MSYTANLISRLVGEPPPSVRAALRFNDVRSNVRVTYSSHVGPVLTMKLLYVRQTAVESDFSPEINIDGIVCDRGP
jgi:hypothetical protein